MARIYERLALHDVTYVGVALLGGTLDCWQDVSGRPESLVRVLTRSRLAVTDGELSGHFADGRSLSGHALVADQQVGPERRREVLVVFHGAGTLHGF